MPCSFYDRGNVNRTGRRTHLVIRPGFNDGLFGIAGYFYKKPSQTEEFYKSLLLGEKVLI